MCAAATTSPSATASEAPSVFAAGRRWIGGRRPATRARAVGRDVVVEEVELHANAAACPCADAPVSVRLRLRSPRGGRCNSPEKSRYSAISGSSLRCECRLRVGAQGDDELVELLDLRGHPLGAPLGRGTLERLLRG